MRQNLLITIPILRGSGLSQGQVKRNVARSLCFKVGSDSPAAPHRRQGCGSCARTGLRAGSGLYQSCGLIFVAKNGKGIGLWARS